MFAERPAVFPLMRQRLDDWYSSLQARDEDDESWPIFWITGPSGMGKSVALLFALAHIARSQPGPVYSLLRQRRKPHRLSELIDWWASQESNANRLTIAIDDPYVVGVDSEGGWRDAIESIQPLLAQGASTLPVIVCCGPSEQMTRLLDDLGPAVEITSFSMPTLNDVEKKSLRQWFVQRTNMPDFNEETENPSGNLLIVQLFWEWNRHDTSIENFATSLKERIRLEDAGRKHGPLFEVASTILAFTRAYLPYPSSLLSHLEPRERGFYTLLRSEEKTFRQDSEESGGEWFNHPHLADLIYRSWMFSPEEQIAHLIDPLRSIKNSSSTRGAAVLSNIATALTSIEKAGQLEGLDACAAWTQLLGLYDDWGDDDDSLAAWVEIRTAGLTYRLSRRLRPDPVTVAIRRVRDRRHTRKSRWKLGLALGSKLFLFSKQFAKRARSAIVTLLTERDNSLHWPILASYVVAHGCTERIVSLASDWLGQHLDSPRQGWLKLWRRLIAWSLEESSPDRDKWSLQLLRVGRRREDNHVWPHCWFEVWKSRVASSSSLDRIGRDWLASGAAPSSKWYRVWLQLRKYAPADAQALGELAVYRLKLSEDRSVAWERVFKPLLKYENAASVVQKAIQLAETRNIRHSAWGNTLRSVFLSTKNQINRMRLLTICRREFHGMPMDSSGWGSLFGVVWDNRGDNQSESRRLETLGQQFIMNDGAFRLKFASWSAVWVRLYRASQLSEERRLLIRQALSFSRMLNDPKVEAVEIRKELQNIWTKGSSLDRNALWQEVIVWLNEDFECRAWTEIWFPFVLLCSDDATESSEERMVQLGGLLRAAGKWLQYIPPTHERWCFVFANVLRRRGYNEVPPDSLRTATRQILWSELSDTRALMAAYQISLHLPDWVSIHKVPDEQHIGQILKPLMALQLLATELRHDTWPTRFLLVCRLCDDNESLFDRICARAVDWLGFVAEGAHVRRNQVTNKLIERFRPALGAQVIADSVTGMWLGSKGTVEFPYFAFSCWLRIRNGYADEDFARRTVIFIRKLNQVEFERLEGGLSMIHIEGHSSERQRGMVLEWMKMCREAPPGEFSGLWPGQ